MACQINYKRKVFAFTWILENFEFCEQDAWQCLKSPTFIVETIDKSKWSLRLFPRGAGFDGEKMWISLILCREEDSKGPVTIELDFELAFLAVDGSVLTSHSKNNQAFLKNGQWGLLNFVERESVFTERSKFLPHDALMMRCRMWKTNGEADADGQCIARTRIGVERRAFLWKISDSSNFQREHTETFMLNSTSNDKPIISLEFGLEPYVTYGDTTEDQFWILARISDENISFAIFKFDLIDAKGKYWCCSKGGYLHTPYSSFVTLPIALKKGLMDKKDLWTPDDTLTLYCEVFFSTGTVFEGIEGTIYGCTPSYIMENLIPAHIKESDSNLKMDLGSMLRDEIQCDVKLCTESETFPAHRLILGARSPVFRAMFQSDMREKVENQVNIEDLKPDTVRRMLLYMYTDSLEELEWETASDLYAAAEKYQIMPLKDECSFFLKSNLSLYNACKILLLSDLFQDNELKSAVQDFILKNDKTIINSSDWKLLMKDNIHLAAETMLLRFKE